MSLYTRILRKQLKLVLIDMARINLTTEVNAPVETCFDLSRSIDLHLESMRGTNERAISGVQHGLIGLKETVTWQARHFGVSLKMTIKISELMYATSFTDEQIKGPFKYLKHRHIFQFVGPSKTVMIDEFDFESPLGFLGKITDQLVLKDYLTKLLKQRNKVIKKSAEAKNVCLT